MPSKIVKSNIILIGLITFVLALIIILVDFSKETPPNYNVDIYKAYYVYDPLSNPINMSYYLINTDKNTPQEKVINKIINKILPNISTTIEVENVFVNQGEIVLTINEDITKYNKHNINCLVNSLTQLKNIVTIKFINSKTQKEMIYQENINNYYIISPITDKLYSLLYRDLNYKIKYIDHFNKEKYLTIKELKEHTVTYLFENQEYQMKVTKDGLYLNNEKILNKTYKTNEQWDNYQIKSVRTSQDNALLINITNIKKDYQEEYVLKQGIGIYSYTRLDLKGNVISSLKYQQKELNND